MILEEISNKNRINFENILTPDVRRLGKIFKKHGHEIRVVGGAVRDTVLGKDAKDIDLATTATPEEMVDIANNERIKYIETGLQHGTITFVINGEPYEITTLRIDEETDGRHASVSWTRSFKEDAARRDLTFNAMSVDMDGNLHDYFGGLQDIKNNTVSFVGDISSRISEDYLRILRYFRFMGKQSTPKENMNDLRVIKEHVNGLDKISGERIWAEMSKILTGKNVSNILSQMHKSGVLDKIEVDRTNFTDAERTSNLNAKPETILCHLLQNINSLVNINKRYKLSNAEYKLSSYIIMNRSKNITDNWWKEQLIMDGVPKEFLMELALYHNIINIANRIKSFNVPKFPITGDDLIKKGYTPGPELGKELNRQKREWFRKLLDERN
jgi:tRNA nucleotidyltransferase (CCA-adding enzyme)